VHLLSLDFAGVYDHFTLPLGESATSLGTERVV
jgi:hypothetical protein